APIACLSENRTVPPPTANCRCSASTPQTFRYGILKPLPVRSGSPILFHPPTDPGRIGLARCAAKRRLSSAVESNAELSPAHSALRLLETTRATPSRLG